MLLSAKVKGRGQLIFDNQGLTAVSLRPRDRYALVLCAEQAAIKTSRRNRRENYEEAAGVFS